LQAVRETHGDFLVANEVEIVESQTRMCEEGFYIEPTSAATIAGLRKYLDESRSDEVTVSVLTGHGLKATDKLLMM
jgi:threonine synthase